MLVHQCHSSVISSDFRIYSWVRLGLGVGKWSRLHFWIKMLFQGQQNMLTQEHILLSKIRTCVLFCTQQTQRNITMHETCDLYANFHNNKECKRLQIIYFSNIISPNPLSHSLKLLRTLFGVLKLVFSKSVIYSTSYSSDASASIY